MLTVHGMNMLIFFIIFFEMAVLYFASAVLLNCRVPAPKTGWIAFLLMVVGTLMVEWTMWTGRANVLFTSYVPLRAHPLFYLGVIPVRGRGPDGGRTLLRHPRGGQTRKDVRGVGAAGHLRSAHGGGDRRGHAAARGDHLHPHLLLVARHDERGPPGVPPDLVGLGHSSQQINVAAMVSIWYLLGALTVGAVVLNEKVSRTAFVLYVLFISLASAHHLLVDPGMGPSWKVWNTSYFMYMAVLASMIHGFTVPAGTELGMRLRGATQGLFWVAQAGSLGRSRLQLAGVLDRGVRVRGAGSRG